MSGFFSSAKVNSPRFNNIGIITVPKILIIDNCRLSRMTIADLLSFDGYEISEVNNNSTIFEHIIEQQPDIILLDVMTKEIDGFEICRRLKQNSDTGNIPIMLMSVTDSREERLKGIRAGGDDFLIKPIDRIELLTRVKSLIERKRLDDGLYQTEQVLFSIAKAVESRSSDGGSSARTTVLARDFGTYLQLTPEEIDNLLFAAHLHDIGTIAIPDAVMLKKGKLTAKEKELISQHVLIGEKICQPLRNRSGVLPIIRHHHERWDGTGYPDGLAGDSIPYLAQVFQIIDIYDALTSERPHKQAYTPNEALAIITEETQKGWRNPSLVANFAAFIHEN
ncbi:HD domain-containing phosphohydrolase [Myxosarcina sp. GI1]|uniref:HD domain-containing phosphohydrolase n=1 Tax=Myxosarcina sp. GI1 TaxID=1541065 RepID=UPI00055D5247|nr:HD domain-containing phosphohydrolase [Myxosarcina sp. GI1]